MEISQILMYLEHDWEFPSTNQHYKTAKYELHPTSGDGDTADCIFTRLPRTTSQQHSLNTVGVRLE